MPTVSENLQTALEAIATALAAGASTTPESYTLDGKSVTRGKLEERFAAIQKLINQQSPYVISTKMVL